MRPSSSTDQSPAGPASTKSPDSGYDEHILHALQPGEREHRRIKRLMCRLPPRRFRVSNRGSETYRSSLACRCLARLMQQLRRRRAPRLAAKSCTLHRPAFSAAAFRRASTSTPLGNGRISAWPPPFSAQVSVGDGRLNQVDQRIEIGVRRCAARCRSVAPVAVRAAEHESVLLGPGWPMAAVLEVLTRIIARLRQ